jgi:hypothetical protein
VREIANFMGILSQVFTKQFEKLFVNLFTKEVIFKNLNSGTKLISEITDSCIHRLLFNIQSDKVIVSLTSLLSFKNATVRVKGAEYLRLILARYLKETLLKEIE